MAKVHSELALVILSATILVAPPAAADDSGGECYQADFVPGGSLRSPNIRDLYDVGASKNGVYFSIPTLVPANEDEMWYLVGYLSCTVEGLEDLVDCVIRAVSRVDLEQCLP